MKTPFGCFSLVVAAVIAAAVLGRWMLSY